MPDIEVDQSGRMEMPGDTTVAASDGFMVTVRVSANVKREVREVLRDGGVKPKLIMIRMFVGAILLSLQDHLAEVQYLTIDEEHTGYEEVIKSLLLDRLRGFGVVIDRGNIRIAGIGKKSPAHRAAIRVTRRQASADKSPTVKELLEVC